MAREETLAKRLAATEAKRKKLRRQLQLIRMRAAGKRRKATNKVYRAVGALLEKHNAPLFEKLMQSLGGRAKTRTRRGAKKGAAAG
jgi:hypothetical protein